jgi:hypothetical protein
VEVARRLNRITEGPDAQREVQGLAAECKASPEHRSLG